MQKLQECWVVAAEWLEEWLAEWLAEWLVIPSCRSELTQDMTRLRRQVRLRATVTRLVLT